ncbi:MAG: DoxX family protein [Mojavia pulchra JT2-VF2]|jgi:putative oxidoreductase|uniref:DoxX family protein n=1 Tax=Mojavia pulchra JT2-VF2 TaxID=287848 RepID=A0A951Q625_9NOST|nr:DoxX family protein [Mojavia pulchra JT2-VF2]
MQLDFLTQFLPPYLDGTEAYALLALRLIWGTAMMFYGLQKLKDPFHWLDLMPNTPKIPGFLQAIGAVVNFFGGIATIVGFLTPIAELGLAVFLGVALILHLTVWHSPFIKPDPSKPGPAYDEVLIFLGIAIMFLFVGPGSISIDYLLFG